jgi:hypothetical protein
MMLCSDWHAERLVGTACFCRSFTIHDNKQTDRFLLEGFEIAGCVYTVSDDANPLRVYSAENVHFFRLQTVSHSILSTRIVLHTGRVLREGIVDPEQAEHSRRASHSVELQRLINEGT